MRRHGLRYVPALAWAVFLLLPGSISHFPEPAWTLPVPMDKVGHFVLYGTLGVLAVWAWRRAGRWPRLPTLLTRAMLVGADTVAPAAAGQRLPTRLEDRDP